MIGVLATAKTLKGFDAKFPKRYPKPGNIAEIFSEHPRTLNLIHYASKDEFLFEQLCALTWLGGTHCDGFQLNMAWPSVSEIADFHARYTEKDKFTIVLQVGDAAFAAIENSPHALARKLSTYIHQVDYVLLDQSGGLGKALDVEVMDTFLEEIYGTSLNGYFNIGIAGGLDSSNIERLKPLIEKYPYLSIDAEGRLRDPSEHLNIPEVIRYLTAAYTLLPKL